MAKADKASALQSATIYYALAIVHFIERTGAECLIDDIVEGIRRGQEPWQSTLLDNRKVLDQALSRLVEVDVIEIDRDEYGPPIVSGKSNLQERVEFFSPSELAVINRYYKAGNRRLDWLLSALENLRTGKRAASSGSTESSRETNDIDWQPLSLERDDKALQSAAEALERTIEAVRTDNGYIANCPEESRYVLDKLRNVSKRLKEDSQISWMYLREFAFEPLALLVKRLGDAATGLAAASARAALIDWLKTKGVEFLSSVFK